MARPRTILLRERAVTPDVPLTTSDLKVLREGDARLKIIAGRRTGVYDIEASQIVGTIVGPDLHVVIQPKISVRRLVHLLRYLPGGPDISDRVTIGADVDLLEAMQLFYARALTEALAGGLIQDYREERELLALPRGRLDALRLVTKRFGLFPPLECEFQEYTADVEVNRRLAAAARLLTRVGARNHLAVARLRTLLERFEGVRVVAYTGRRLEPLRLDRRTARYGAAPALAELVLARASIELQQGYTDAVGFLLNMDDLYERFVVVGLREALGVTPEEWVHHPVGLRLDIEDRVEVTPDAVWRDRRGAPVLVLDAKYKQTVGGLTHDIYQMLAYCTALGVSTGVLVYASGFDTMHVIRNADVTVHVLELSPDGTREELDDRLGAVGEHLRALVRIS